MALLELRGIAKHFGAIEALKVLVAAADAVAGIRARTGRDKPDVIT